MDFAEQTAGTADDFSFGWELREQTGAVCTVGDAAADAAFVADRPTDAITDILHGLCGLYGPLPGERFFFRSEPVEFRWVLDRQGTDVDISIYLFPDVHGGVGTPDSAGLLVWRSRQARGRFVHAVLDTTEAVLDGEGARPEPAGRRTGPSPLSALVELRRMHRRDDGCGAACRPATPEEHSDGRRRLPHP
ncbi:hypothetical protein ACFOVU_19340 [Nocardiopsis sediminis]|uniref:Uncharacterized protein n=1 Tax=Nocardiopsis sediminis TaxID=1778267 RepID=A0ABV8FS59_9ACTN